MVVSRRSFRRRIFLARITFLEEREQHQENLFHFAESSATTNQWRTYLAAIEHRLAYEKHFVAPIQFSALPAKDGILDIVYL